MSRKDLRKHFKFKSNRQVNVTKLIKNLIWQAYTWIKIGQMDPLEGNLRSFWYRNVKSVLSRLGLNVSQVRYMEKVYDVFVELVTVHRLFRYADFGFVDGGEDRRFIGKENGHLLLFVEKNGLSPLVKEVAGLHKATGVSLGGFPSCIETEFLVRKMAARRLLEGTVHLFCVVDFDPSGYWIEKEFVKQLKSYEIEIGDVHSLITPDGISPDELEKFKFKLQAGAKTRNWVKITGGIGGEDYGLEADAFGCKEIRKAYEKALAPYLKNFKCPNNDEERMRFFQTLAAPSAFEVQKG